MRIYRLRIIVRKGALGLELRGDHGESLTTDGLVLCIKRLDGSFLDLLKLSGKFINLRRKRLLNGVDGFLISFFCLFVVSLHEFTVFL